MFYLLAFHETKQYYVILIGIFLSNFILFTNFKCAKGI